MNTASVPESSTPRTEIEKIAASFRSASSSQANDPPRPTASPTPQNSLKIKELERVNMLKMSQSTNNVSPPSSSRLYNVFRSAFATIDIENDTFSVSSQTGFSSALLHEMELLQGNKRKENTGACGSSFAVGVEPSSKRKREDSCPHQNYRNGGGKEDHQYADVFVMSVESTSEENTRSKSCNSTIDCPEKARQQSSLVFSWVASRLRTAEQNMQKLFDNQEESHRVEIEALKAEHAREKSKVSILDAESYMTKNQVELPVLETIEIERTDRSRVDQALESHLLLRRQVLSELKENAQHDGLLRERLVRERAEYYSLRDAIYSQLDLQQCHHFNLQSINRNIVAEKNSELKRLGKELDARSMELRLLQESSSRFATTAEKNQGWNQQHAEDLQQQMQGRSVGNEQQQLNEFQNSTRSEEQWLPEESRKRFAKMSQVDQWQQQQKPVKNVQQLINERQFAEKQTVDASTERLRHEKRLENYAKDVQQLINERQFVEKQTVDASTEKLPHQSEIQHIRQQLCQAQIEKSQLTRQLQEMTARSMVIEESRVNIMALQQLLHREHLSGTQLKTQMQEMINARAQTMTQQHSALNTHAAEVIEKKDENHSKEIKKMVLDHLGQSKACNRRLEHMANLIKQLTAENRELKETISTLEESLEKTTKALERLSERNLEHYNTIKELNGKI